MAGVINWFEIPATDVSRACKFYESIIGSAFQRSPEFPDNAFFDHTDGTGGEICRDDNSKPGVDGTLIYLNAPVSVADALSKVEAAGGKILTPLQAIGPHGFIGIIIDTEGNRVGLHNMQG